MVLFVVDGIEGILNFFIILPRNTIVLLLVYEISQQKYALQVQCIFAIIKNTIRLKGDIMLCENFLCVYEKDGECILDEIKIDISGQCACCIYPNIDSDTLKNYKNETLINMQDAL